ncbi:MAG: hypothetical protein JXA22_00015 [Candidatus Thermoplasmatota archaeon]|nr:hypothetical protein [Candidatus Thermoplasmatota archaeon]
MIMIDTDSICMLIMLSPMIFLLISIILTIISVKAIIRFRKHKSIKRVIILIITIFIFLIFSVIVGYYEFVFVNSGKESYDYSIEITQNSDSPYYMLIPNLVESNDHNHSLPLSEYSIEPKSTLVKFNNNSIINISCSNKETKIDFKERRTYFGDAKHPWAFPSNLLLESKIDVSYYIVEIYYFNNDNQTCNLSLEFQSSWSSNVIGGGGDTFTIDTVLKNGMNEVPIFIDSYVAD